MAGDVSGDLTGRRLGNYRIDGVLGRGGMSVMYKATDVRLGRKVALKVIGDHLGTDAEFRERFVDEARNTSAIDHANVVPLYDFGELDGMLYIAMRLVDGSDLASLIGGGAMDPDRALRLLDQVADALDTLHARGLVHLDVKPANVLVTSRESVREHVYVADFGLTRRGATGHRTRGGDFLGSPTYAAPEHLRGEPLDGRTDQYALACVLYACLTGSPPYQGDVPTVIKGHLSGEPPPVSRLVNLPGAVDDVIRRGMAKDPKDRYPSCVALIDGAREAIAARSGDPAGRPGEPPVAAAVVAGGGFGGGRGQALHPQQAQWTQQAQQAQQAQLRPARQGEGTPVQPYGQQPQPGYGQGGQQGQPQQGYGAPTPGPGTPPQGYGPPVPPGAPGMGTPPSGMGTPPAGGMPGMQPPAGYGPPPGDPMRVRPPAPAGGAPFGREPRGSKMWLLWVGLAVLVVGGVVTVLILALGGDDERGGTPPAGNSPAPEIPVGGPDESATGSPSTSAGRPNPPPTSIPVVPSR
ncbi:serine/threonine protein kinase [Amycolatopsis arida]|uniref:non-specific serine/threonine protein kinase n=1 Tax=Amycolatopsis arida TaxID=587909 RepID=A0A1I5QRK9_9PSEU|nr:serine/threonine-protein kinase [Amycolatopsis arida]TDX98939.1 serine/threonine-protein kinase [Amycolatopsis arida]SFP48924.1 serine/threonine protein kinase [Amycolatopsis arida]